MKNGIYYTDGEFLLSIDDDSWEEGYELAKMIVAYKNDVLQWSYVKDYYSRTELLRLNAELVGATV